jgi:hypothetical protein
MVLFAISINPLLGMLEENLRRTRCGKRTPGPALLTYANDVTIILRMQEDIQPVRKALATYIAAPGARLNIHISKAMALGTWNTRADILGVPYVTELNILGTRMSTTVGTSARQTWNIVTGHTHIKQQAKDAYNRALTFDKGIEYVQTCLLARVWYMSQVFPPPTNNVRQINTALAWFLWTRNVFRMPLSTLYRDREYGVWGLTNVEAMCTILLINGMQILGMKHETPTALWLDKWNLTRHSENPPM